jgi:hypothetical protein
MKRTSAVLTVLAVLVLAISAAAQEKKAGAKVTLPAAVAKAVNEECPNSEIDKMDVEKEAGINLYDIEFKAGRGEIEVAEDGTVMDISTIVEMKDIPEAAAAAIQKAAKDATIRQIEKSEVLAEIKIEGAKGRIVKLDKPTFLYEAELAKGKQMGEIQVAPDGKILEALKWSDQGAEKD